PPCCDRRARLRAGGRAQRRPRGDDAHRRVLLLLHRLEVRQSGCGRLGGDSGWIGGRGRHVAAVDRGAGGPDCFGGRHQTRLGRLDGVPLLPTFSPPPPHLPSPPPLLPPPPPPAP